MIRRPPRSKAVRTAERIRAAIAEGRWLVDGRPSDEPTLYRRYGVDRLTLRRALALAGITSPTALEIEPCVATPSP